MAIHGDGVNWTGHDVRLLTGYDTLSFTKCWGANTNDMYFVGLRGSLARYDGTSWRRLESGTMLDVYDVFGNDSEIFAVAAKQFVSLDRRVLRLSQTQVDSVTSNGIPGSLRGIWFKSGRTHYVVGNGIYGKHSIVSPDPWIPLHGGVTQFYLYAIDGAAFNDIFVCGSFGELLHFNGLTWRTYRQTTAIAAGAFYKVAVKSGLCIAVGYDSPRGVVAIGRR